MTRQGCSQLAKDEEDAVQSIRAAPPPLLRRRTCIHLADCPVSSEPRTRHE